MQTEIYREIQQCTNLPQVRGKMLQVFEEVKEASGESKIGYVAGIISSQGEENYYSNLERLGQYTDHLRVRNTFPIFSSSDLFSNGVYEQMEEVSLSQEKREGYFHDFWRSILKSGHVTDIFMTPRWDLSKGATDEYNTALTEGIAVHFVDESIFMKGEM